MSEVKSVPDCISEILFPGRSGQEMEQMKISVFRFPPLLCTMQTVDVGHDETEEMRKN